MTMKAERPPKPKPRLSAKDRALGLLAVRWRSKEELRRRLRQAGYEPGEVDEAVEVLERAGLVEDERFAAEVVRAHATTRLSADRAIRAALREKGVAREVVDRVMADAGDEATRAFELASRKAGRFAGLPPEAAYRRLFGLLGRRGYPPSLAREAAMAAVRESHPAAARYRGPWSTSPECKSRIASHDNRKRPLSIHP
jgi:regulatory protein